MKVHDHRSSAPGCSLMTNWMPVYPPWLICRGGSVSQHTLHGTACPRLLAWLLRERKFFLDPDPLGSPYMCLVTMIRLLEDG
jgi:hypothetical protein